MPNPAIITSPWPEVELTERSVWEHVWSNPNNVQDSAVAIIDGPSGRTMSRGELRTTAQKIAYGFRHKLKLPAGAVICVFSPNSSWYHMLVMAVQCSGNVVSGANAAYTDTEMAHQLSDSGSAMILCHPQVLEVALAATTLLGWTKKQQRTSIVLAVPKDEAGPAGDLFIAFDQLITSNILPPHKISAKDAHSTVAFLGFSSGTSGKAKGVRTSHYNMTSVLSMLSPFDVSPADTQLVILPLNHIYGLTKALLWPLRIGTPVVILPKFDLVPFCALVQKYRATVCLLVPPIALLLAREPVVDEYDLSSLRLVLSGAAPLGKELETELSKRIGTQVTQAYGLTEASPTTHYCPLNRPTPGSIGPLLPMMRGRICDPETGKDVAPGEEGEMLLQGPNVMLGYLNRPESNAETLITDEDGVWLKTGDIAFCDAQGYWFITDRLKELIKYKGFQVAPAELESTLLECPYVADAAVIGVWQEDQATELPRAYGTFPVSLSNAHQLTPAFQFKVVLSAEGKKQKDGPAAVRAFVDGRVAAHKKLRGGVRIVDTIPKSPSGKLLRKILREEAKAEAQVATPARAKL
ncbi:4-coumarate--CoA ligase, partial [Phenoliferia sp. Uapishka_3]